MTETPEFTYDPEQEDYTGGSPKYAKTPKAPTFPSVNKKAKNRPGWYRPSYWTPGRTSQLSGRYNYGPYSGPAETLEAEQDRAIHYAARQRGMSSGEYAMMLIRRYPNASPAMIASLAATGTLPDENAMIADVDLRQVTIDSQMAGRSASAGAFAQKGMRLDRETKNITLNGESVTLAANEAVVRDWQGIPQRVIQVDDRTVQNNDHTWLPGLAEKPYDLFKGLSRNLFAFAEMPVRGLVGALRNTARELGEGDWDEAMGELFLANPAWAAIREMVNPDSVNAWEQTEGGQTLLAFLSGKGVDQGDGFFVSPESSVGLASRQAAYDAYNIDGVAWSPGRGFAGQVLDMDPDQFAYRFTSGLVDATVLILGDPVTYAAGLGLPSKALKATSGGKVLIGKAGKEAAQEYAKALSIQNRITELQGRIAKADEEIAKVAERGVAAKADEAMVAERAELQQLEARLTEEMDARGWEYDILVKDATDQFEREEALASLRSNREQQIAAEEALAQEQLAQSVRVDNDYLDNWVQLTETEARIKARDRVVGRGVKVTEGGTKDVPAKSVEDLNADLLTLTDNIGFDGIAGQAEYLRGQGQGLYGVRTVDTPRPKRGDESAVVGAFDEGGEVLAYWRPRPTPDGPTWRAPNLLDASDEVGADLLNRVWDKLESNVFPRVKRDQKRFKDKLKRMGREDSPFVQRALASLDDSALMSDRVLAQLTEPGMTYNQMLDVLDERGLAPYLDDVFRDLDIDGITGLGRTTDNPGFTWWGMNPDVDVYNARLSRYGKDPEIRIHRSADPDAPVSDLGIVLDDATVASDELNVLYKARAKVESEMDRIEVAAAQGDITIENLEAATTTLRQQEQELATRIDEIVAQATPMSPKAREAMTQSRLDLVNQRNAAAARISEINRTVRRRIKTAEYWETSYKEKLRARTDAQADYDALSAQMGVYQNVYGQQWLQHDQLRRYFFGSRTGAIGKIGAATERFLLENTDNALLFQAFNGKLPIELVKEITENARIPVTVKSMGTEERVYQLLKDTGLEPDRPLALLDDAQVSSLITQAKQENLTRILAKATGIDIHGSVKNARAAALASDAPNVGRIGTKGRSIASRASRIIPTAIRVDLAESHTALKALDYYFQQSKLFTADEQLEWMNKVFDADGVVGQEAKLRNVLTGLMDELQVRLIDDIKRTNPRMDEARIKELTHNATRIFQAGMDDIHSYYHLTHGNGMRLTKLTDPETGKGIQLPSGHLDSEFASGSFFMPPPGELRKLTQKMTRKIEQSGWSAKAYEVADTWFSDYWRSLVLMRGAYIIRNVAEMEIRNFLAGHPSMFNHPIKMIAMTVGDPEGNTFQRFMERHNKYQNDIYGYRFGSSLADDTLEEAEDISRVQNGYLEVTRTSHALSDLREYRRTVTAGKMEEVGPNSPQFVKGWATELLLLRQSSVARIVANGPSADPRMFVDTEFTKWSQLTSDEFREGVINWFYRTDEGDAILRKFAAGGPEHEAVAFNRRMWEDHLFGTYGNESSVSRRIDEFVGNNDALRGFVRTGMLTKADGSPLSGWSGITGNNAKDYDGLASALRKHYYANTKVEIPPNVKVWAEKANADDRNLYTKVADAFFKFSARAERMGVMGPEFRYVYWRTISDYAHMATPSAKAKLRELGKDQFLTLTDRGKPFSGTKEGKAIWNRLQDNKSYGGFDVDDLHKVAMDRAQEEVKRLYYDASQRRNFFQSTRLIMPFGQAWGNSFAMWAQLGAANPVQVYKAQRAFNSALEEGSNVVYEMAPFYSEPDEQAPWYDPNQGFIQVNRFGEPEIIIPLLGTGLSKATNALAAVSGVNANVTMESGFKLKGLNLLFGGDSPLPGMGPAVTLPAAPLMDRLSSNEFLYEFIYPFGEPDITKGPLQAMAPAWAQRMLAAVQGPNSQYQMDALKPALGWLTNNGEYDLYSAQGQQDMIDDAGRVTAFLTAVRGIGQFVLPTTPTANYTFEGTDGRMAALSSVSNLFYSEYMPMYDQDFNEASQALLNDYGANFLLSTISTTRDGVRVNDEAWEKIRQYPDLAEPYTQELATLFPGGEQSLAALSWQRDSGRRKLLTPSEVQDQWTSRLWQAETGRVKQRAKEEKWSDEKTQFVLDEVERKYADLGVVKFTGGLSPTQRIDRITEMIERNPPLKSEPAVEWYDKALAARSSALAAANAMGLETMKGKKAGNLRFAYFAHLDGLKAQYPGLSEVVRLFKSEQGG